MLQITAQSRIFVAVQPVDGRKGIDGLVALCKQVLQADPMSGALFVFKNRLRTSLKILCYDGQGFLLCTKRLSSGKFQWWPNTTETAHPLTYRALQTLLWNGDPQAAKFSQDWKALPP